MDSRKWDEIAQAVEAYRQCPHDEQFDVLSNALADSIFYVPVGDFDGSNAAISLLHSVQGGAFLPLYADKANVRPAQHSEGVRPADWQHILSQLSDVQGCVIEPYSVNFAFDSRFVDALVSKRSGDGAVKGGDMPAEESSEGVASDSHTWVKESDTSLDVPSVGDVLLENVPVSEDFVVPETVSGSLNDAMQAVADECGTPLWLFEVRRIASPSRYLMIINAPSQWFNEVGVQAVNNVLGRFPDPGVRLDFVPRDSEFGSYVEGKAPHYSPRVNAGGKGQGASGRSHNFLRRLFKR
ncbi:MAG: SseB family protein [Actinomycetaceae bacterium]|nr:SseB family protein [Actinomycetaceae bacterium]